MIFAGFIGGLICPVCIYNAFPRLSSKNTILLLFTVLAFGAVVAEGSSNGFFIHNPY